MTNHHYLSQGLPRLPPPGRLSCSRLRVCRVSGPRPKWLLNASTIGPEPLRTAPCPHATWTPPDYYAQLASGAMYNFCSAFRAYALGSVAARSPAARLVGRTAPQLDGTSTSTQRTTWDRWAPSHAPTSLPARCLPIHTRIWHTRIWLPAVATRVVRGPAGAICVGDHGVPNYLLKQRVGR